MKRRVAAAAASIILAGAGIGWAALLTAPPAEANPLIHCTPRAFYVGGHGGGWCDSPPHPDGTWTHCENVRVFGIGGTNCYNVRAVPVDVDPRGWTPV